MLINIKYKKSSYNSYKLLRRKFYQWKTFSEEHPSGSGSEQRDQRWLDSGRVGVGGHDLAAGHRNPQAQRLSQPLSFGTFASEYCFFVKLLSCFDKETLNNKERLNDKETLLSIKIYILNILHIYCECVSQKSD
jgi:hypothetical protein